jgi:hypothetical protein
MPRNLLLCSLILLALAGCQARSQSTDQTGKTTGPKITFDQTGFDFGLIPYNSRGEHIFTFTNSGTEPLLITNCVKGCGCTSVNWTKELLRPGEKGMIKVVYNTRKIGYFNRGVDVYSNDVSNYKVSLRLRGTVQRDSSDLSIAPLLPVKKDEKW